MLMGLASLMRPDIPVDRLIETYANESSFFLPIDGMDVHIRDEGNGPALLLLHGTFSSLHTWDDWTEELCDSFRVIRLDLPGFGLTGPHPANDYSNKATLLLLDSLRQNLNISTWSIAGNSLGGRLAIDYARHFPRNTDSIILLNPAYSLPLNPTRSMNNDEERMLSMSESDSATPIQQQNQVADSTSIQQANQPTQRPFVSQTLRNPVMLNLLSVLTPRSFVHFALKEVYADEDRIQMDNVQRYFELLRRDGNRKTYLTRNDPPTSDRSHLPELPTPITPYEIEAPILIMWGEQDKWIPVRWAPLLNRALTGSELIIYPDAGHVPMEEIPSVTVRDAKDFLKQHYSAN
jgi:pimeloyl-ACP methyl ester carboxylesterase